MSTLVSIDTLFLFDRFTMSATCRLGVSHGPREDKQPYTLSITIRYAVALLHTAAQLDCAACVHPGRTLDNQDEVVKGQIRLIVELKSVIGHEACTVERVDGPSTVRSSLERELLHDWASGSQASDQNPVATKRTI